MPFWQRHWATWAIHIGLYFMLFAFELALFQRPWFATINVLSLIMLVVQVSNAKFKALREPFIMQDFEYFTDALKHPRLYIPFLGIGRAAIAALGFALVVYAGLSLESAITDTATMLAFLQTLLGLVLVGMVTVWIGAKQLLPVSFDPNADLQQLGLFSSLWRYGEQERIQPEVAPIYGRLNPAQMAADDLPHLVVVQSESFFDARQLSACIRPSVLQEFDRLKSEALYHGRLAVSAWGANTVRTEFAFLSGLSAATLGVHRFNPYRKLAKLGLPSLALFLQAQGYRTVCVHPFHASFYGRDQVMPKLGFDEFIDLQQFGGAKKAGPFIGDQALADKVAALLSITSQPLFIFVITMENHGPLHLEKVTESDIQRFYLSPPPTSCEDLTIYLRHLQNADQMAASLRDCLLGLERPSCLCWYGDHVPIMPSVYQALATPDGNTDYFIWHSRDNSAGGQPVDATIENLGLGLLVAAGLAAKDSNTNHG
ncbi:MAG: LTA synthase family protein [Methylococcales bacterium]|nr:LTA synthase family protein [Methylococcales bacterium]